MPPLKPVKAKDIPLGYASIIAAALTALLGVVSNYLTNGRRDDQTEAITASMNGYDRFWQNKNGPKGEENEAIRLRLFDDTHLWREIEQNRFDLKALWVCGASLQYGYGKIKKAIADMAKTGKPVKILVTNPESSWLELYAMRKEPKEDVAFIRMGLRSTLNDIAHFMNELPPDARAHVEVYLLDFPLDERMHILNPEQPDARIFVKDYPFHEEEGILFGGLYFEVDAEDGQFYTYYLNKYKQYLKSAVRYQPKR